VTALAGVAGVTELLGSFNSSRPESLDGLRVGLSVDSHHYGELLVSAP
jgi:hypothetical protein